MQAEPLIRWPQPIIEYIGFVATFFTVGAIGFRYIVLRGGLARAATVGGPLEVDRRIYDDSARRASIIGVIGALVSAALLLYNLSNQAARRHSTISHLVTSNTLNLLQVAFLVVAIIGFLLATGRISSGWILAAIAVLAGQLRAIFAGQWLALVNPIHVVAGGFWIGTLFVMVAAGISAVLRDEPARARRGAIVADMVNSFSPLALTSAGVLVLFGLITAWRHLHVLSNLWSTPYGWTLLIKLCLVALVFALGAWNWRRQRPTLGTEETAVSIRGSSRAELTVAGIVLVATAVLVSLPSPRAPKPATPPVTMPSAPSAAPGGG